MLGNMTLGDLIDWLEKQDQNLIVQDGFGSPHSDRGSYDELAFSPVPEARISDMLKYAKSADGEIFTGWKGGKYTMRRSTSVYIGQYGECGEEITQMHFKYWLLSPAIATARAEALKDAAERLEALNRWACDSTKGEMFRIAKGAYVDMGEARAALSAYEAIR